MESIIKEAKIHLYQFMEIEILHQYIDTGIEYMVKSILNSNHKFIHLRYYSHEITTLISGLKDAYFLIKHKAIYAQNFYGLQRSNIRTKTTIFIQMLLWIVLPYLFKKIQQYFIVVRDKQNNGGSIGIGKKMLIKIFPIIYCIVKIVSVVLKFKYLIMPSSKYYNIQYWLGKTQLGYLEREKPSPFPIMSFLKSPGLFILLVAHKIASSIFATDHKQKQKADVIDIIAPINIKKSKQCPICGKTCKNPSVLKTSGYVYCYNCIIQQLRSDRKCPVTQLEADEEDVQLIYQ